MNLQETDRVLTFAAIFDRRKVEEPDVLAWQTMLEDYTEDDCMAAVKEHYSSETRWLMPADVIRIAGLRELIRADRLERGIAPEPLVRNLRSVG